MSERMERLPYADRFSRAVLGPRDPVLDVVLRRALIAEDMPTIQVSDAAGHVLQMLTAIARPMRALEIGTLFGYSAIYIGRGLPPGGCLTSLEIDPRLADLARRNVADASLADSVHIITGDAIDYLSRADLEGYDLMFIDGEKTSYPEYLRVCYPLLREGGLLIADDAFARGDYTGEAGNNDEARRAILRYNRSVAAAPNLQSAFVGTGTGMMVSVKVGEQ